MRETAYVQRVVPSNMVEILRADLKVLLEGFRPTNPDLAKPFITMMRAKLSSGAESSSAPETLVVPPSPPPAAQPAVHGQAASEGGTLIPMEKLERRMCAHSYGRLGDWRYVHGRYVCKSCSMVLDPNDQATAEAYEAVRSSDPERKKYEAVPDHSP